MRKEEQIRDPEARAARSTTTKDPKAADRALPGLEPQFDSAQSARRANMVKNEFDQVYTTSRRDGMNAFTSRTT